jgi:hypothetical protein
MSKHMFQLSHLVQARPVPRCYTRPRTSTLAARRQAHGESYALVLMLSAVSCMATFLIVYNGWSF